MGILGIRLQQGGGRARGLDTASARKATGQGRCVACFPMPLATPSLPALRASPPTDWASESDTCVMEKRDAGAGDTVKREKGAAVAGVGGTGEAGAAEPRVVAKAALAGARGKPSQSNPPPATGPGCRVTRVRGGPAPTSHSHLSQPRP